MIDWPPFSSDAFLETVRDVYLPKARIELVECRGVRVRTLVTGRNKALSGFFPFLFYLEPVPADSTPAVQVPYLNGVVVAVTGAREPGPPGAEISPFVRFDRTRSWEEFLASVQPPEGLDSVATVRRKAAKLEKSVGELCLQLDDPSDEAFRTLIEWKAEQYRSSGGFNRFVVRQNVDFYWELRRRGLFTTTTLRAGDTLVGGRIGMRMGQRHLSRVTVYNRALSDFSPGSILELEALRASFMAGDTESDFLMGSERYKFIYATHARWLAALGSEPLSTKALRVARGTVGNAIRNSRLYPGYKEVARRTSGTIRRVSRPRRGA